MAENGQERAFENRILEHIGESAQPPRLAPADGRGPSPSIHSTRAIHPTYVALHQQPVHPAADAEAQHSFQPGKDEADAKDRDDPGDVEVEEPEGQAADAEGGAEDPGEAFRPGRFPQRTDLHGERGADQAGGAQGRQAEGGGDEHVEDDEGADVDHRV